MSAGDSVFIAHAGSVGWRLRDAGRRTRITARRVNAAFPIKLDRALLIAAFSLQFRNQRTARLTDFPYCVSFAPLISSMWRTPGELSRPQSPVVEHPTIITRTMTS